MRKHTPFMHVMYTLTHTHTHRVAGSQSDDGQPVPRKKDNDHRGHGTHGEVLRQIQLTHHRTQVPLPVEHCKDTTWS